MKTGLVIYVADLSRMSDFYEKVFGLKLREVDNKYISLGDEQFELVILKSTVSEKLKKSNSGTVQIRELTPIKPVFIVDNSIGEIRKIVKSFGGGLKSSETEWEFNNFCVCDGWDPEGNIFQVRSL